MEELRAALCILVAVVGGGFVLLCCYALSGGGVEPDCDGGCGVPLVNGYEAYHEGKRYCRACARKRGLRAWYAKQLPNGEWLE